MYDHDFEQLRRYPHLVLCPGVKATAPTLDHTHSKDRMGYVHCYLPDLLVKRVTQTSLTLIAAGRSGGKSCKSSAADAEDAPRVILLVRPVAPPRGEGLPDLDPAEDLARCTHTHRRPVPCSARAIHH